MSGKIEMSIDENGVIRAIYDDALAGLLKVGCGTLKRASHVEPDPNEFGKWTADMGPVGGPLLGPFDLREAALDAERDWLIENYL